ncbi:predicted protein [Phaeodactylum tricornutum CCAP 1055/1]|jgi:hypothetical protein|uniref:Uncharacterized protein n=2 Tax=Phaeodactylum tricornutum TaxID=2850 RepID=B7FXC4_PHATC|nr:predicted protein [Phaeodactylum tricornutum CCAP 1055/1]EEC49136.1 predicted protein [Phaeodactylum tricornutum CCAP 1055/1]|eukprot:XP_002179313.1 predicted protein [Phaeodactylum tricornutum CCAP 1055/1]
MAEKTASNSSHESPLSALQEPQEIANALVRLAASLKAMASSNASAVSTGNSPRITYYRSLPPVVSQAYDLLQQGAALVHGTSTKYTLVGKIDRSDQPNLAQDLLQGCQLIGTACIICHEPASGCGVSARSHILQAARAIVNTTLQLVLSFIDESALEENVGAQKTGAVWSSCDVVLSKTVPLGNRNAIRRDLFTYIMECNETMTEFQDLIDLGPSSAEEVSANNHSETNEHGIVEVEDDGWDAFLQGQDSQFTMDELPVAVASLALVKCSRGSLNVTLQACEAAARDETSLAEFQEQGCQDRCDWICQLVEKARAVGDGMTDLGACMYPPLNLDELLAQIERQTTCIETVVLHILDASLVHGILELPDDVTELVSKVQSALATRQREALEAIVQAKAYR